MGGDNSGLSCDSDGGKVVEMMAPRDDRGLGHCCVNVYADNGRRCLVEQE
jgi:hypothetical protein